MLPKRQLKVMLIQRRNNRLNTKESWRSVCNLPCERNQIVQFRLLIDFSFYAIVSPYAAIFLNFVLLSTSSFLSFLHLVVLLLLFLWLLWLFFLVVVLVILRLMLLVLLLVVVLMELLLVLGVGNEVGITIGVGGCGGVIVFIFLSSRCFSCSNYWGCRSGRYWPGYWWVSWCCCWCWCRSLCWRCLFLLLLLLLSVTVIFIHRSNLATFLNKKTEKISGSSRRVEVNFKKILLPST